MPDLIDRIWSQAAEIERLRRFVTDQSTTCYSCEACGHARTTRECLWCENGRLREAIGNRCECRFCAGVLVEECHYHQCERSVLLPNGDPSDVTLTDELARLRELCWEAAEAIEGTAAWQCDSLDELCHRLRAAAKGEA